MSRAQSGFTEYRATKWYDCLFTFYCPREVVFVHYPTAAVLWFLRLLTLGFICYECFSAKAYLELLSPGLRLVKPTQAMRNKASTFSTGANQTCGAVPRVPLDITRPAYCFEPYVKDFKNPEMPSGEYDHFVKGCVKLTEGEIRRVTLPTKAFYTTYVEETRFVEVPCSDATSMASTTCNNSYPTVLRENITASDGATLELCRCRTINGFYTVNPEGMGFALPIGWAGAFKDGKILTGGNAYFVGTDKEMAMTTIMTDVAGHIHYRWEDGGVVTLRLFDILKVAGVNLDDIASTEGSGAVTAAGLAYEKSVPYRLKGVTLMVEISFHNFNKGDLAKVHTMDGTHEVVCNIRIRRTGSWTYTTEPTLLVPLPNADANANRNALTRMLTVLPGEQTRRARRAGIPVSRRHLSNNWARRCG